jgi:hypothetical protein
MRSASHARLLPSHVVRILGGGERRCLPLARGTPLHWQKIRCPRRARRYSAAAYALLVIIIGLPLSFWMYGRIRAVTMLYRS